MHKPQPVVTPVALPRESAIARVYADVHLVDAYSVALPPGSSTDPDTLARFIFGRQPSWVAGLMRVRDTLVGGLGLKTASQLRALGAQGDSRRRVGIFRVYSSSDAEIVLGEDDKHLDFRLSVLCSGGSAPPGPRRLVLSTVVHCHNRLGRIYLWAIVPFHRVIVQSSLRRAARRGWPPANAG